MSFPMLSLLSLLLLLSVMAVKTVYNSSGSTLVGLRASWEDRNFPLKWPWGAMMTHFGPEMSTLLFLLLFL